MISIDLGTIDVKIWNDRNTHLQKVKSGMVSGKFTIAEVDLAGDVPLACCVSWQPSIHQSKRFISFLAWEYFKTLDISSYKSK